MSKISFEKKRKKTSITNKLSYPETVNERLLYIISSGTFKSFLPIEIVRKHKYTSLECTVTGLMPLSIYFSGAVSKRKFLDVILKLIDVIKECDRNMISPNNLDLHTDRIFVEPHTRALTCIYWPVVNNQNATPVHMFFKQLPYDIVFNENEEKGYVDEYLAFFDSVNPFSLNNFEKLVYYLLGRQSTGSRGPSGTIGQSGEEKKKSETTQTNGSIEYNPFSQWENKDEGIVEYPKEKPTDNLTVALGYGKLEDKTQPYLVKAITGDRILINKPIFSIGRQATSDYNISNNPAISHNHAAIFTEGKRYFVIDYNSKNKTFVNAAEITPNEKIEIFSGTVLRFADLVFTFFVEDTNN